VTRPKNIFVLVLLALVLIATYFLTPARDYFSPEGLEMLKAWITSLGAWGPIFYVGLYCVACVLVLPGSALTLIAPALFGPVTAFILVTLGSNLGANLSFWIARKLGKKLVQSLLGEKLKNQTLTVDRHGLHFVMFLRLVPLFPFSLLNYLCGFSPLKWWHYGVGTFLGMLPGTFAYVSLGNVVNQTEGGFWTMSNLMRPTVWGPFVLVILLSLIPKLLRRKS
jgi:uncharacterized membrane protein YdjX (TVP38/TMEM64 family)